MNIPTSIETTSQKAAAVKYKKPWLKFRSADRWSLESDRTWIFCDGSTTGWHSAVVVRPGVDVRRTARREEPTSSANVGAELNGVILGFELVAPDSTITVVHDYIGVGAWLTGAWNIEKPDVRKRVDQALKLIREKNLNVRFIHHGGHQKDDSDFTHWNCVADRLCSGKAAVDLTEAFTARSPKVANG